MPPEPSERGNFGYKSKTFLQIKTFTGFDNLSGKQVLAIKKYYKMLNAGNCLSVMYADLGLHTAHHKYTYKYACARVLEREESQNVVTT